MKYTITINQAAALELGDINIIDCAIIEWLRDLCASQHPRIASSRVNGHTWVSYQYAVDDMPLLGLNNKPAFRKRLMGLIEKGYFTFISQDQKVYVMPTAKMDRLFYSPELSTAVNPSLQHRKPQFTAPAAAKQRSAVNPSLLTHNSNTNTLQNSGLGGKNPSNRKPEDEPGYSDERQLDDDGPKPHLEAMRAAAAAGKRPWEINKNELNTGPQTDQKKQSVQMPAIKPKASQGRAGAARTTVSPPAISQPANARV